MVAVLYVGRCAAPHIRIYSESAGGGSSRYYQTCQLVPSLYIFQLP